MIYFCSVWSDYKVSGQMWGYTHSKDQCYEGVRSNVIKNITVIVDRLHVQRKRCGNMSRGEMCMFWCIQNCVLDGSKAF